jgi:hypothetical protein
MVLYKTSSAGVFLRQFHQPDAGAIRGVPLSTSNRNTTSLEFVIPAQRDFHSGHAITLINHYDAIGTGANGRRVRRGDSMMDAMPTSGPSPEGM